MAKDSYKCSLSSADNWERGFAFIITMYGNREGAEIDTGRLEAMAKFLRFRIKQAYEKKADVLKTEIQELASRDEHKDRDCFLCFVNAHGNTDETGNGYIFDNDNAKLLLFDDIIKPFLDSKNLEKKPKVFFINACRGDNIVTVSEKRAASSKEILGKRGLHKERERLENRSDVLIVFSTDVGDRSWRDKKEGSFFVQALQKTLASYHNRDHVVDMMTKLIAEVSGMEAPPYRDKQIPMFESKLSKKLYWRTSLLGKEGKINYIMENGTESPSTLYDSSWCSENPQEADIDLLFVNMFEFPERWCERVEVSTWLSMEESICWPLEWLPSNAGIKHPIRVFAFSCKGFKNASMKDITNKLRQDVLSAKLGQRRPLFLVGHSIGAFIIQSFLLDLYDNKNNTALWPKGLSQSLWDNLLGMAFYDIAPLNAKSWLSTLTSELQEEKGILHGITEGIVLKWLNGKGKRVSSIFNLTSLNEKVLCFAQQGLEYPEAQNHYALQPNIMQVREGHLSICRPKSKRDPIFKRLVDFIELCYRDIRNFPTRGHGSLNPKRQCVVANVFGQQNHFKKLKDGLLNQRKQTFAITGDSIFGLYGMGGIGKTTLAKTIFNDTEIQKHFKGNVYWLIVNRNPDILQKQRALMLEMCQKAPPECEDQQVSRSWLQNYLRSLPRFLLVLDDVWSKLDIDHILGHPLTDVIPSESACLITTRIPEELQGFHAEKIEINLLSDDDSRALFCIHAFRGTKIPEKLAKDLVPVIEDTIRACGNLPILLEAVGSERSGKRDIMEWKGTCERLKDAKKLHNSQYNTIIESLKISYDSLPDDPEDDLKGRFLDFAAFPEREDIEISQVLDLWTTPSCSENNAYWLLLKLQSRCLINISGYWCYIHDFMRKLSIRIIEENQLPLRKQLFAGHNLRKFPIEWCKIQYGNEANEVYQAEKLILIKSQISSIPRNAFPFFKRLSYLKVLVLSSNLELVEVPPEVFNNLEELEKLDLSWCFALTCLPAEIGRLKMLQKLNLAGCVALTDLPHEIGELEELIELNLHSTGIQELPSTIGDCINLRDLTLDDCTSLIKLPAEIGRLQCLEFLDASLVHIEEIPKEVGNLKELRYLKLTGSTITSLPSELGNLRNLEIVHLINCVRLSEVPSSLENLCDGNLQEFSIYNTGISRDKLPGRLKDKVGFFYMRVHGLEVENNEDVGENNEDEDVGENNEDVGENNEDEDVGENNEDVGENNEDEDVGENNEDVGENNEDEDVGENNEDVGENNEDVDSSSEDVPWLPWFDPGDKGKRRMAHGLARMITVVKTTPFESKQMELAVRMIYTMANDCQTRHTVISNGGLPILLKCISKSTSDELTDYAGSTLVNMCVSESTHRFIKDAGGLDVLGKALLTMSNTGRSAYHALSWIMSADKKRKEHHRIITNDFYNKFGEHQEGEHEGEPCHCFHCLWETHKLNVRRQSQMAR